MIGRRLYLRFMFLDLNFLRPHRPTLLITSSVPFPKYRAAAVIIFCCWSAKCNNVLVNLVRVTRRIAINW